MFKTLQNYFLKSNIEKDTGQLCHLEGSLGSPHWPTLTVNSGTFPLQRGIAVAFMVNFFKESFRN